MAFPYNSDMYELGVLLGMLRGLFTPAVIGAVSYVLTSLALYTMAQRREIRHPWLAWVPVVQVWILGSLSDQYRYVVRGENRSKRKSLLVLSILSGILAAAIFLVAIVAVVSIIMGIFSGGSSGYMMERFSGHLLSIVGLSLPLLAVSVAKLIVYFMALSDVYKSMDPANSTVFLVLSILLGVTEPFFLFFNRNKDLGMPPRREPVHGEEPWENQ